MMYTEELRTWAEIDLDRAKNNFDAIRKRTSEKTKLAAVIKANAYGHGAVRYAKLLETSADYFAVALCEEGIQLRKAGIQTPILILSRIPEALFDRLLTYRLTPSIYTYADAEKLNQIAESAGRKMPIHIAVDTGMSRIGFSVSDKSVAEVQKIAGLSNLTIEGIFSHFAAADETDKTYAKGQLEQFEQFLTKLEKQAVSIPLKHLYNSAATLEFAPRYDMLREGIILYGLRPSKEVNTEKIPEIKPVMSLKSKIIHIKTLPAGISVSYGHTYTTKRETVVATVCAGYADGVPRALSGKGNVLVRGKKAPILGRVCMDQFMIDVTEIPDTSLNDTVTIFGEDGDEAITADEIAETASTIGYEIVCLITPRVPRIYKKNGKIFAEDRVLDKE